MGRRCPSYAAEARVLSERDARPRVKRRASSMKEAALSGSRGAPLERKRWSSAGQETRLFDEGGGPPRVKRRASWTKGAVLRGSRDAPPRVKRRASEGQEAPLSRERRFSPAQGAAPSLEAASAEMPLSASSWAPASAA